MSNKHSSGGQAIFGGCSKLVLGALALITLFFLYLWLTPTERIRTYLVRCPSLISAESSLDVTELIEPTALNIPYETNIEQVSWRDETHKRSDAQIGGNLEYGDRAALTKAKSNGPKILGITIFEQYQVSDDPQIYASFSRTLSEYETIYSATEFIRNIALTHSLFRNGDRFRPDQFDFRSQHACHQWVTCFKPFYRVMTTACEFIAQYDRYFYSTKLFFPSSETDLWLGEFEKQIAATDAAISVALSRQAQ